MWRAETPKLVSDWMTPSKSRASRVLHRLRHLGVAGHTHVGADQRRLGGGEKATSHEAGRHRQAEAARKPCHLGFQAVPAQLDAGHDHRHLRPAEAVEDLLGTGGHRLVVHRRRGRGGDGTALGTHHVPGQFDVDRPRPLAATAQYAGDIGGRPGRIVEHRLVAGDLGVDTELGVQRLALVMEEQTAARLRRAGGGGNHHQRAFLGIGPGHRVDHVEGAGAIGDGGNPEGTVEARRGVRREADGGFVADRVQGQDA